MAKKENTNEVQEQNVTSVSEDELSKAAELLNENDGEEMEFTEDAEEAQEEEVVREAIEKAVEDALQRVFQKRRVHGASKTVQKELYAEDNDTLLDKSGVVLTEKQKRKEAAQHYIQAARSIPAPMILTGITTRLQEISGRTWFVVTEINENKKPIYTDITVKIPASQFFAYNKADYEGPEGAKHFQRECVSRLNSEVRFIVYDVDEKEGIAIGSRLAALERDGIANYYKKQADGVPKICEGMKIPARVIGVRKDRVRVEVRGADTTMSNRDLSWTSLDVLTDEFKTGEGFMVKVSNIRFEKYEADGKVYNLCKIDASRKEAMVNPADKYYEDFNVGDIVVGTIKSEAGPMGVFVNLDNKMDALCENPLHGVPGKGMRCTVQIVKKMDETKRIKGIILDMN